MDLNQMFNKAVRQLSQGHAECRRQFWPKPSPEERQQTQQNCRTWLIGHILSDGGMSSVQSSLVDDRDVDGERESTLPSRSMSGIFQRLKQE
jgi:DNA-binding PucR family transcriptional regulator